MNLRMPFRAMAEEAPPQAPEPDLPSLFDAALNALRRDVWLLAAALVAGLALGAALAVLRTPDYTARAAIIIDPRMTDAAGPAQAPTLYLADALLVDSEVEVLRSERLMNRVARRLGLVPEVDGPGAEAALQAAIARLSRSVSVGREARTFVIRITATDPDPTLARDIAAAVVAAYFAAHSERLTREAEEVSAWLQAEAARLGALIAGTERETVEIMRDRALPDPDRPGYAARALAAVETVLIAETERRRRALTEAARLAAAARDGTPAVPDAPGSPDLAQLRRQLADLAGRPGAMALTAEIEAAIGAEFARLADLRRAEAEAATAQIDRLRTEADALSARLHAERLARIELDRIGRETAALRARHEALLARIAQSAPAAPPARIPARLIEAPLTPDRPSDPPASAIIAAAAAAALLAGLGLVFLRAQIDDSLRSSRDVVTRAGLRYLGPVPRLSARQVARLGGHLLPRLLALRWGERRRLALACAALDGSAPMLVGTLKRALFALGLGKETTLRLGRDTPWRCIGVTSALAGEGKTFLAANLAVYLARSGHSVLLIDGDFTRRELARAFAGLIPAEGPGAPRPMGPGEQAGMLRCRLMPGLELVFAAEPARGAEGAQKARMLVRSIEAIGQGAEMVVIDLPSMSQSADPLIFSRMIHDVLIAVEWGRISARLLRRTLALNAALAERVTGAVLSRAPPRALRGYEGLPGEASDG